MTECKPYDKCFEFVSERRKLVICTDKKSSTKYKYDNTAEDELSKYNVDGCLLPENVPKCDFLLLNCTKKMAYFIELKGSDLINAVEQVEKTIDRLRNDLDTFSIHARIVLTRVNTMDLKNSKLLRLEKKVKKLKGSLRKSSCLLEDKNT